MRTEADVCVDGRVVHVSSLDRVLWPAAGVTKAELLDYYVRVAHALLPHVAGRPVTLHRFPEGIGGPHFFQTRTPPHPPWVRTATLSFPRTGKTFDAPVLDDLPALVWAANLSTLEVHPFLGRVEALDRPTAVAFDLDPGPPAGMRDAAQVALAVHALLEDAGLVGFAKTSGSKGMHVFVPLNGDVTYEATKGFARSVAARLTAVSGGAVTDRMSRALRPGRVFVDWSQNDPGKSTVAVYSLRGTAFPSASTPVTWPEVESVARGQLPELRFGPDDVLERLERLGDLFAPVLSLRQELPPA
ncbi:non-homologous end-joining DNA ligase [Motilibacter deserti]|uniref:ATP-dependent DNA ligase n=1 Tax=Motilibacter deserti TaxID=2714956 RepID=A0ABX0GXG4_9ACTN|nr:ATP-dependent DNA ligase [Motilibacter deserti]